MPSIVQTCAEFLSPWLGAGADDIKQLICLLLALPLSTLLHCLPKKSPQIQNIASIAASTLILTQVFEEYKGLLILLATSIVTFYTTRYKNRHMPWIIFAFSMFLLVISHYRRLYMENLEKFDVTAIQMIFTIKITSFAWSVSDGRQQDKRNLTPFQAKYAIINPTLLDYLGYLFFIPTFLAGPALEYNDYTSWLNHSIYRPIIDPKTLKQSRYTAAKKLLLESLVWFGLMALLSKYFRVEIFFTVSFFNYSFTRKCFILYIVAFIERLKYYGVWKITEAATVLSGISYNGIDSKQNIIWNRCTNVKPLGFERAQSVYDVVASWNIGTNRWLKNYIYNRIPFGGPKPNAFNSLITFMVSAVWHGLWSGYYLSFMTIASMQILGIIFHRHLRPLFINHDGTFKPLKRIYDFIGSICVLLAFSYTMQPFILLTLRDSIKVWNLYYFFVHVVIICLLALDRLHLYKRLHKFA